MKQYRSGGLGAAIAGAALLLSLGAVVVLLMWFYLSVYIVLAGAEFNSAIEKARRR